MTGVAMEGRPFGGRMVLQASSLGRISWSWLLVVGDFQEKFLQLQATTQRLAAVPLENIHGFIFRGSDPRRVQFWRPAADSDSR